MRIAIGILLAALFFGALVFTTLRESAISCEVCVVYAGERVCRTSAGADRPYALQMAQSTACAVLARGVTRGLECQRTPPASVRCEGD